MAGGQKKIYYITGGSSENLANSPKLESFKKKDIEVLLLSDAVDEIWVNNARKFDEYDFVSVSSDDIELPEGMESEDNKDKETLEKSGFAGRIKDALSSLVEDVKLSNRLVDSPACFVQRGEPISPQMRNFFRSMGQDVPEEKRVLELNPSHPLIKRAAAEAENENTDMKEWGALLMGLASISDGEPVADGKQFTDLISKLLEK